MKLLTIIALLSSLLFAQSSTVKLRKGDTIKLNLKGVPSIEQTEVSGDYLIDHKGYVRITYLPKPIYALGMDSSQLAREVEDLYKKNNIYTHPNITIFASGDSVNKERTVQVLGMVRNPGPIAWKEGLTAFEAISFAGGKNDFGSYKKIRLTRKSGSVKILNFKKNTDKNYRILPEDILEVGQGGIF